MKSRYFFLFSIIALASCSNESIIDANHAGLESKQTPIGFEINKGNISRVEARAKFEEIGHYNFGVWAYKYGGSLSDQKVMDNYLVGYSDESGNGYDHSNSTTWASISSNGSDYKSCWFYESLGKEEYTYSGEDGYYKNTDSKFMSANNNQYLRYWDLAYTYTNFYAYAPYKSSGVTLTYNNNGDAIMKFEGTSLNDGYDNTPNSEYMGTTNDKKINRNLAQNMYACVKATNSSKSDVNVQFKHMGAQLFIRFYEEIPGYKVEIINLGDDDGTFDASVTNGDLKKGIQATPSVSGTPKHTKGSYYKTCGGTVNFTADATATYNPAWESTANTTDDNLMFFAPSTDNNAYATTNVPEAYKANLRDITGAQQTSGSSSTTHHVIPEIVTTGADQTYAWSPTIYYPVAQKTDSNTGFNFHVSYRIISDDNKEVTTVHNATVFVPAKKGDTHITAWQPATRYIYTFKITKNSTGTTDPSDNIDPTDPTPSTKKSLYPIVFDEVTIVDYTDSESNHDISEDGTTNY